MKTKKWFAGILLVMAFFVFGMLPSFSTQAAGTARALLVTRGDYDSRRYNLSPGPENDGVNFLRVLEQGWGDSLTYTCLEKEGAQTASELDAAISEAFAGSEEGDVNYFLFSGHGMEDGMWLGGSEVYSASQLAAAFEDVQGTTFLVVDCCYSGSLISRSVSAETWAEQFVKEFQEHSGTQTSRSRQSDGGGTVYMIAASAADELSVQGTLGEDGEEMGYFTSVLAAGCGVDYTKVSQTEGYAMGAGADTDINGEVSFGELYSYVSQNLWVSTASVSEEDSEVCFLPLSDECVPSSVVTEASVSLDEDGNAYLNVSYEKDGDITFTAGLYNYTQEDAAEWALLGLVPGDIEDRLTGLSGQTGSWTAEDGATKSSVSIPFQGTMEAGDYVCLVREENGNTGGFLFMVSLEQSVTAAQSDAGSDTTETTSTCSGGTIEEMNITLSATQYTYDGTEKCPLVTVQGLTQGTDYMVLYTENVDAGQGEVWIWGIGNYSGLTIRYFTIAQADISDAAVKVTGSAVYKGKKKKVKPATRVTSGGVTLVKSLDYTLRFKGNKKIGYARVTVTGIGNYTGSQTVKFKILPQKPKRQKAVETEEGVWKVSWKASPGVDGYVIQYSTDKNFRRNVKTKSVKGRRNTLAYVSVSGNKTVYFRVRSYKKVNGKRWYSS